MEELHRAKYGEGWELPRLFQTHTVPESPTFTDMEALQTLALGDFMEALYTGMASLVAQWLKRLPRMWETWVRSLNREDPLEKEMATHSSTLAWGIPWTEEPGGLQFSSGTQSCLTFCDPMDRSTPGFPVHH